MHRMRWSTLTHEEKLQMIDNADSRRRPATVQVVFWVILLGLVLDIVVAAMTTFGGVNAMSGTMLVDGEPATNGPILLAMGIGLFVLIAIELFVLFQMRAGHNWARIVVTVLEVLSLGALAFDRLSIPGILSALISVLIIVLLWVKPSNVYFRG
ncbi:MULTISPECIES: hypothetical protein [unclassified Microbacterium]|uniref:hypothetical protein n=1 Tax=unclassified Microbacterium TaxID=2609290 RepID=UPI00300FFFD3